MKTLLILMSALAAAYGFDEEAKETIRKNFPAAAHLEVDNVHGFVHVSGYNGSEIQMVAEKRIVAESKERLEVAQREVKLDISQSGDTLTVYVDGPFRCNCGDRTGSDHWGGINENRHRGYRVIFDFEIKVPAATIVRLGTVNEGDIRLENTTGDFDLNNVNHPIEAREVAGSGQIHTVNGGITALFIRNPKGNCSFRTVNGTIEASFRPGLNADVRVKTFNGRAYTDYDVAALPRVASAGERRDGKFIYRSDDFTGMRIGSGGPEFKFNTLNGSIRIINRGQ
jgi:hypothetical protein